MKIGLIVFVLGFSSLGLAQELASNSHPVCTNQLVDTTSANIEIQAYIFGGFIAVSAPKIEEKGDVRDHLHSTVCVTLSKPTYSTSTDLITNSAHLVCGLAEDTSKMNDQLNSEIQQAVGRYQVLGPAVGSAWVCVLAISPTDSDSRLSSAHVSCALTKDSDSIPDLNNKGFGSISYGIFAGGNNKSNYCGVGIHF